MYVLHVMYVDNEILKLFYISKFLLRYHICLKYLKKMIIKTSITITQQ